MQLKNLRETAEFRLTLPVEYADSGEQKSTLELFLICPSIDQWNDATKLRKALSKAIIEHTAFIQDQMRLNPEEAAEAVTQARAALAADDKDDEPYMFDAEDIARAVELSDSFDLPTNIKTLGRLLISGSCKVDCENGPKLNQIQWSKIHPQDKEGLLATFLENFTQPYSLRAVGML